MLCRVTGVGVAACVLGLSFGFGPTVQAQTSAASGSNCPYWADSATGKRVHTLPQGLTKGEFSLSRGLTSVSGSGHNYVSVDGGETWINSATGQPVATLPQGLTAGEFSLSRGLNSVSGSGHNYFLVPCPPPQTAISTGLYIGGELAKSWGHVRSTERLAATDVVTNQFSDSADPFGGGIIVGYTFAPWANNIVASAFASFDFLHAPVNHTFPGGSFLGSTANFMGTAGVKIGPRLDMGQGFGLWLYGIAGVSVLNETLNVNFIPVASSQSAWVAGATVGAGAAWQPGFLQGFGRPVSLFVEYQHTWWQDATFNAPAASPAFNYTFRREDDVVKFGFTVSLNAPPPPPMRRLITK